MPLYETIMIARVVDAATTTVLLKSVAKSAILKGGNVRDLRILGDRILSKAVLGKDKQMHLVGRYASILFDGNDEVRAGVEYAAKQSFESIRMRTFKHRDFVSEATIYKRAFNQYHNPVQNEEEINQDFIQQMAALVKIK